MSDMTLPVLVVEYAVTRDAVIDEPDGWSVVPCPPPGPGWQVADDSSDKRTKWRRLMLVDLAGIVVGGGRHG